MESTGIRVIQRTECRRILVANSKGGCGKTTIATNLACQYANNGKPTALIDYDPQGSSSYWLKLRPNNLPAITGITATKLTSMSQTQSWQMKVPREIERLIIDTPAGLTGTELYNKLKGSDVVILPILPSPIDIHAATQFINELELTGCFRDKRCSLLVVANRVKQKTLMFRELNQYLHEQQLPSIMCLRDAQIYMKAHSRGLGIADLPDLLGKQDKTSWKTFAERAESKEFCVGIAEGENKEQQL